MESYDRVGSGPNPLAPTILYVYCIVVAIAMQSLNLKYEILTPSMKKYNKIGILVLGIACHN